MLGSVAFSMGISLRLYIFEQDGALRRISKRIASELPFVGHRHRRSDLLRIGMATDGGRHAYISRRSEQIRNVSCARDSIRLRARCGPKFSIWDGRLGWRETIDYPRSATTALPVYMQSRCGMAARSAYRLGRPSLIDASEPVLKVRAAEAGSGGASNRSA